MLIAIRHEIQYRYSKPVFVEPMTIRLRPRHDFAQRVEDYRLEITPEPDGQCDGIDIHNNVMTTAWFSGLKDSLTLTATSRVRTLLENPFAYLITDPMALSLPMQYPDDHSPALAAYLRRPAPSHAVDCLARELREKAGDRTQRFLDELTWYINEHCEHVLRPVGPAYPPGQTLREKQGACRDTAVLFMDVCRSVGIAARFVSGYKHFKDGAIDTGELHAWAEAYLPGAGWRGYDPSEGVVVADRHVVLATAAAPDHAAATNGSFRGTGATSHIDYAIHIDNA